MKQRTILQRLLEGLTAPLIRLFDTLYRSAYNPLYRSGTLAVGMLLLLLVTGLYLVFFYSVSHPYESLQRIHDQAYLGRWIRAMHRYATDIAIVAVVFHVVQMMIQGRTWGPRVLAWISGSVLLFALMLSTWTGYVMAWDTHGQWLANAGARMIALAPFLNHQIMRTFSGAEPLTGSFFFMNLFLHVAIPLVMVTGIWIHTARLNRARWLPMNSVFVPLLVVLLICSVLISAPLLPKADLQALTGRLPTDLFSGFWLPLLDRWGPGVVAVGFTVCSLGLLMVPWWWRVRRPERKSTVDTDACAGCMQCYKDCPFEAIDMLKRDDGSRRQFAMVNPAKCVSCGLCAGSCDDYNVGPPGRKGDDQLQAAERYLDALGEKIPELCLIYCESNRSMQNTVHKLSLRYPSISPYAVACTGSVHAYAVEHLMKKVPSVLVVSCPEENCVNRRGHELALGRLLGRAGPHLSQDTDLTRIQLISAAGSEYGLIETHVRGLLEKSAESGSGALTPTARWSSIVRTTIAHSVIVLAIAAMSMKDLGTAPTEGVFRLMLELPGNGVESARAWTEEELSSTPAHMRLPQKVVRVPIDYTLLLELDGQEALREHLKPRRDGRLVLFGHDLELEPGTHDVRALLIVDGVTEPRVLYDNELQVRAGEIVLFDYDGRGVQDPDAPKSHEPSD